MCMSMARTLNILIAQLNPIVGDIDGNLQLARNALDAGRKAGADLVGFSEFFILGYPPEDLLYRHGFLLAPALAQGHLLPRYHQAPFAERAHSLLIILIGAGGACFGEA